MHIGREREGERHLHSDVDLALLGHWLGVLCARAVGCSVLGGQCAIFIGGRDACTGLVTDTALVAGLVTYTALVAGLVTDTALVAGLVTDATLVFDELRDDVGEAVRQLGLGAGD